MKDISSLIKSTPPNINESDVQEYKGENQSQKSTEHSDPVADNEYISESESSSENLDLTNVPISDYMLTDPHFVGFESNEQQERIYRLASFGVINNTTTSVIDLGCGRGDFGSYIKKVINPDISYTGVDVNPLMERICFTKYAELSNNNLKFIVDNYYNLNSDTKFDWVFNNINCTIPYGYHNGDKWQQLFDLIDISIEISKVGVVFLLLNDKTSYDGFYQYNTGELISYLDKKNFRYAVDYSDIYDVFKLIIFKQPF